MANKLKFRRGYKAQMPLSAEEGEPIITLDTGELYIGAGLNNSLIPIPSNQKIIDLENKINNTEQFNNILYKPYWNKLSTSLATNFREDANGDLEAYVTTPSLLITSSIGGLIDSNKDIKCEFEINVDTTKTFGALIGFCNNDASIRFLVGYEPVHKAIEFYYGGVFYKLIDNPTNGQYKFIIEKDNNNKIYIYINGELYKVSDYVNVSGVFNKFRMHLKTTDLGLVIKNLNLKYIDRVLMSVDGLKFKQYGAFGNIKGSGVYIYHFGGKGNDWCFVRTPSNYDPQGKPHPFVICNHGNGWNMDGTESTANWTSKTQWGVDTQNNNAYLNTSAPYYKQYSNETIERLLEAGYVVCGAENYGDSLFGNDNCRQACVDFYNHMVKNYNVEEKCYMIGASNGAMTSLNAMYLLGGITRVKAMILQYPLTCLWRHYNGYPAHQTSIETAYGISTGLTELQFEKATRTHDPEKVCTVTNVNGVNRFKTIAMPPIKIWYSNDDITTSPSNNSLPFIQLLEDSNCVCESVQATGGHGDYTHFNPASYLSWFEKWR